MAKQLSPIEMLFDKDNNDNIVLFDEQGNKSEFQQIALLPYNKQVYAILRPLDEDLEEDEAKAYLIEQVEDDFTMTEVIDDKVLDALFEVSVKLAEQQGE